MYIVDLNYFFLQFIFFSGDGELSLDEIRNYYRNFVGIGEDELEKVANEGYRAMTAVRALSRISHRKVD